MLHKTNECSCKCILQFPVETWNDEDRGAMKHFRMSLVFNRGSQAPNLPA